MVSESFLEYGYAYYKLINYEDNVWIKLTLKYSLFLVELVRKLRDKCP